VRRGIAGNHAGNKTSVAMTSEPIGRDDVGTH
jgi:hypothetical protein